MKIATTNSIATLRALCIFTAALLANQMSHAATPLTSGEVDAAYSEAFMINPAPEEGSTWAAINLPPGLSMNASTAVISGVPSTIGLYDEIVITLTRPDLSTNQFEVSIEIAAASGTPVMTSGTTASGTVGEVFQYVLLASNSPSSFNVVGDLQSGLSFSGESISGTPTTAGEVDVLVSGNNNSGTGDAITLTITIEPAGAVPVITGATTLSGDADELLSYQIVASESPTSYTASGLPVGLAIAPDTGFISGTPTIDGVYQVELTASNSNGSSDVFDLEIIIGDVPQISSSLTISATEDTAITDYLLSANNSPTSFTIDNDALPDGLAYDSGTRKITGTPTESGTFSVAASASNAVGDGPVSTIVITVEAKAVVTRLRPVEFDVQRENDTFKLFLVFDQSVQDLAAYDWFIETSTTMEPDDWTAISVDDESLVITITDNEDASKSVSVLYPGFDANDEKVFFRYRVEAKSGQ